MVAWIALALALVGCISPLTFLVAVVLVKRNPQLVAQAMAKSMAKKRAAAQAAQKEVLSA